MKAYEGIPAEVLRWTQAFQRKRRGSGKHPAFLGSCSILETCNCWSPHWMQFIWLPLHRTSHNWTTMHCFWELYKRSDTSTYSGRKIFMKYWNIWGNFFFFVNTVNMHHLTNGTPLTSETWCLLTGTAGSVTETPCYPEICRGSKLSRTPGNGKDIETHL